MLNTAQERVKLLKTGLSGKEIERLYIEHNNFKIIRTPILYDAKGFEFSSLVLQNNRKSKSIPALGLVILLALFIPISTLFITLILMLFIPPIFALAIILNEGKSIISNELQRQNWVVKKPLVISI